MATSEIVGDVVKIVLMLLGYFIKKGDAKTQAKTKLKEAVDALKAKEKDPADPALITRLFDRINRM